MHEDPPPRPTYARIDLDNLAFNYNSVRNFVGRDVRLMAVVKADAYGHGIVECSRRLDQEGADWFAVATLDEASQIRAAGVTKPILCFGGFHPGQEDYGLRLNIVPVVFTLESAERIDRAAERSGRRAPVHVKVDTGMGRVGIPANEVSAFADRLALLQNIDTQAVMTHFAVADDLRQTAYTAAQADQLRDAVEVFRERGLYPSLIDMANSPGSVAHPDTRADMVRIGGILFGLGKDVLPQEADSPCLKPVLSLHTRLAQVKRVPAGSSIGYGRTFVTTRESVIGTVPIGYRDGYFRELSNRGVAIVNNKLVPVAGRVSMDWLTLDITNTPDANVGDEVTLIGSQGDRSILAEDVAALAGTISYEITCGLSERVQRKFVTSSSSDVREQLG